MTPFELVLSRLSHVKGSGRQRTARCPTHHDRESSLSVKDSGNVLLYCHAGCQAGEIVTALGLEMKDLFLPKDEGVARDVSRPSSFLRLEDALEVYDYVDEEGRLQGKVARFVPKAFRPFHRENGNWKLGKGDVRWLPYRLPSVITQCRRAEWVIVVEGEKDVLTLERLGFVATTNAGGAEAWKPEYGNYFTGGRVAILPDHDKAGNGHCDAVVRSVHGKAKVTKVLELPGLPAGGKDVTDWVNAGGTAEELRALIEEAPEWSPGEAHGPVSPDSFTPPKPPATVQPHDQGRPDLQVLWPVMRPEGYHGLFGEIVETIYPHTEADKPALLIAAMAIFGCAARDNWYALADGAEHPGRIFPVLVGETSSGRKGMAQANVARLFRAASPVFMTERVTHGLASGEGLIAYVADPPPLKEGEPIPPPQDKRLLVVEPEFSRVLKVAAKEGSTVSQVIRQSWDSGDLRVMTRHQPLKATGAHITITGHITRAELRRHLSNTEIAAGFANRFVCLLTRRSKMLPEGGNLQPEVIEDMGRKIAVPLRSVQDQTRVRLQRSDEAKELWADIYNALPEPDGIYGAVVARAAPQMLRLQVIFAMADGNRQISAEHVLAAKAVWDYADASAELIFSDAADPRVVRFVEAVRGAGKYGLDGTAQHDIFDRHVSGEDLDAIRAKVERAGLVETIGQPTGGRPKTVTRLRIKPESAKKAGARSAFFAENGFIRKGEGSHEEGRERSPEPDSPPQIVASLPKAGPQQEPNPSPQNDDTVPPGWDDEPAGGDTTDPDQDRPPQPVPSPGEPQSACPECGRMRGFHFVSCSRFQKGVSE